VRILMLAPQQNEKYNWGHQLFREEIARRVDVFFYGFRYPIYEEFGSIHVPEIVAEFGPFDVIFVEGPKHAGYFTGMEEIRDSLKVSILVDYVPPYLGMYNKFIQKMCLDVAFVVCPYSLREFVKMQRREAFNKHVRVAYLPFSVDTDVYRNLGMEKDIDVTALFAQVPWCYKKRKAVQKLVGDMQVKSLIGGSSPGTRVVHEEYVRAINRSKIFLSSNNIYNVVSLKYFECLACGTFLLTDRPEGMEELGFVDGEHLVIYKDLADLERRIKYYLEHGQEREAVAKKGMALVRSRHSGSVRAKQFLKILADENFIPNF